MLDPQPVAPGYMRRWALEAAQHVWRHAQAYVLLLAVPILPALFAAHDPWRTLAGVALGPFAVRLSFELAASTLAGPLVPSGFGAVLRRAGASTAHELRRQGPRLALMLGGFALAWLLAAHWPWPAEGGPPADGVERTAALFLPVAVQLFAGFTLVYGVAPAVGCLAPLLARVHGPDLATAAGLAAAAERRNRRALYCLDQALHLGVFVAVVFAPPIAPLVLAAWPALLAMAMREIFGPRDTARESTRGPAAVGHPDPPAAGSPTALSAPMRPAGDRESGGRRRSADCRAAR